MINNKIQKDFKRNNSVSEPELIIEYHNKLYNKPFDFI